MLCVLSVWEGAKPFLFFSAITMRTHVFFRSHLPRICVTIVNTLTCGYLCSSHNGFYNCISTGFVWCHNVRQSDGSCSLQNLPQCRTAFRLAIRCSFATLLLRFQSLECFQITEYLYNFIMSMYHMRNENNQNTCSHSEKKWLLNTVTRTQNFTKGYSWINLGYVVQ